MRVLFYTFEPFVLAQGAREIQITRTCEALKQLDVEVEFLRWYDGGQRGDVLHFFGRISTDLLGLALNSGMKVVVTDWLSEQAFRSAVKLKLQRWLICIFERALPRVITENLHWRSYRLADACVVMTQREADVLSFLFEVSPQKVHVICSNAEEMERRQAGWTEVAQQLKSLYEKLLAPSLAKEHSKGVER